MSDLGLPNFLPTAAPRGAILDLSHELTDEQVESLNGLCQNSVALVKFKIVILPKDFQPNNTSALTETLAKQWQVSGDRILLVVDLAGHKVRTAVGHGLNKFDLNGQYMTNIAIKENFLPAIKSGDLYGALQQTIYAVQRHAIQTAASNTSALTHSKSSTIQVPAQTTLPSRDSSLSSFFFVSIIAFVVLLGVAAAIIFAATSAGKKRAKATMDTLSKVLNQRAGILFEKADHLGQSSEYLLPDREKGLAQQVSIFFARLDTLTKAKEEAEKLLRAKKKEAVQQLKNCILLADALDKEATPLLEKVNSITGQVGQFEPSYSQAEITVDQNKEVNDLGQIIPISYKGKEAPYMVPSWTRDKNYLPANYTASNDNSFLNLALILNQMNLNWQMSQLSRDILWQHSHNYPDSPLDLHDHGSSNWDFSSGGGDWGDSSGSDWGSSDWGGGDFDGGGGDW